MIIYTLPKSSTLSNPWKFPPIDTTFPASSSPRKSCYMSHSVGACAPPPPRRVFASRDIRKHRCISALCIFMPESSLPRCIFIHSEWYAAFLAPRDRGGHTDRGGRWGARGCRTFRLEFVEIGKGLLDDALSARLFLLIIIELFQLRGWVVILEGKMNRNRDLFRRRKLLKIGANESQGWWKSF